MPECKRSKGIHNFLLNRSSADVTLVADCIVTLYLERSQDSLDSTLPPVIFFNPSFYYLDVSLLFCQLICGWVLSSGLDMFHAILFNKTWLLNTLLLSLTMTPDMPSVTKVTCNLSMVTADIGDMDI